MSKKDKKVPNEVPINYFNPTFIFDPFKEAIKGIERIIFDSGLPYNIEYRPDDGYFSLELYKCEKDK